MKRSLASIARKALHQAARTALALLPRTWRFAFFRNLIDCDDRPAAVLISTYPKTIGWNCAAWRNV